jgi:hypothetical protein
MASGAPVVQIIDVLVPAANAAQLAVRAGGSTPAERVPVWGFDGGSSDEYLDFLCRLHGYGGGGLTFTIAYSMASATSGNVRWGIAIRRMNDASEDIDTSQTYDFNEAHEAVPGTSGAVGYMDITFTTGADMDSWADGELAIVRLKRDASDTTNDTATGDAELWGLFGKET